jgi:uncharacterized protein (TIGR02246 family)
MNVEEQEVGKVVSSFANAWNPHDMNDLAKLFADDAQFVNVVGLWWIGRAEIRAAHEFTHQTLFRNSRLTVSDISVRFPTKTIAVARCRWALAGHASPEGEALPERIGILVNVIQRDRGRWLIIDSQNTDVVEGVMSRPQ